MIKLNYLEGIEFILDNFKSYQDLISTLNKYRGGSRLTSLPDLDRIIFNNQDLLNSIAGEINSGQLDLFNQGMDKNQLEFWLSKHYPTKDSLESLIELYSGGDHLEDIHSNLVVINNFDNIIQYYQDKYTNEEPTVEDQIEQVKETLELATSVNEVNAGVKTFSVELFNEEETMNKTFSDIPTELGYLDQLQASIKVAQFNAQEMHWNVSGKGFKGVHELLGEVYEKLDKYLDELVETRMSNNEAVSIKITKFIYNSKIAGYDVGECPIAKELNDLTELLQLCLNNQDELYSDFIGRLITDINHYKFMFEGYLTKMNNGEPLDDLVIVTSNEETIPTEEVIEEALENSIPEELSIIKSYCTNKRQAKCFNELLKSFSNK